MNFDEFCKGSFRKWDGDPPEGVKTWDRERGRFVDPFTMKSEARKFTEQMDAYVEFMNNGRLSGDISSGYTYEVNDHQDDTFRQPRYYGARGNGKSLQTAEEIIKTLLKNDVNKEIIKGENTMPTNYNTFFNFATNPVIFKPPYPEIKDVRFNPPATIVFWKDDTKTVVKTQNGEPYDPEKGLAMAIVKKVYGNKGRYFNGIKKWTDKYRAKKEAEAEAEIPNEVISEPAKKGTFIRSDYFYARFLNFDTREEALDILDKMKEVRDTYGYVSVADLADLVGVNSAFLDSKLGWRVLRGSQINRVGNSYKLRLPEINWVAEGYEIKE